MEPSDLPGEPASAPPPSAGEYGGFLGSVLTDAGLEAEYRAQHRRRDGRTAAITVLILVLLSLPFTISDRHFIADPDRLTWLTSLRVAEWLASVTAAAVMLRSTNTTAIDVAVLIWNLLNVGLNVAIQSTRPPDYHLQFATDLMYVAMVWTVVPNRFTFQLLSAFGATLSAVVITGWVRSPLPGAVQFFVGAALFGVNLAGALVAWRLHRTRRSAFLDHRAARLARDELAQALAEVRTLRGLVPICAGCKSIRDAHGEWKPLEAVLLESTEATLSHGMCPACMQRLYPEYA